MLPTPTHRPLATAALHVALAPGDYHLVVRKIGMARIDQRFAARGAIAFDLVVQARCSCSAP
jgi:hypothetical protein